MINLPPFRILYVALLLVACAADVVAPSAGGTRTQLPPLHTGALAVVGADVVPMTANEVLEDHTLVIVNGRIVAIGPADDTQIPEDAEVIDGTGLWVMPGLMDMHVHVRREDLAAYRRAGITTLRNMWGTRGVVTLKAEVTAGADHPTIYSATPGLDGNPPVWPGSVVVTAPEEARAEVQRLARDGWDFVKVYNRLSPAVYEAILAEASDSDIPVIGHIPLSADLEDGFDPRHASIEHLTGFAEVAAGGRSPTGWLEYDESAARTAAEDLERKGTWMCPTLVVLQHLAETRLPAAQAEVARAHQRAAVAALHDTGVPLLAGTDGGLDLVPAGISLATEIGLFVDAGLSHYEALRAATVEPARFLGITDELGTIEVGKRADLVLLNVNPLESLSGLASPVGLIQRGKRLY